MAKARCSRCGQKVAGGHNKRSCGRITSPPSSLSFSTSAFHPPALANTMTDTNDYRTMLKRVAEEKRMLRSKLIVEDLETVTAGYLTIIAEEGEEGATRLEEAEVRGLLTLQEADIIKLPAIAKAHIISRTAHYKQRDTAGVPYFLHPQGVVEYLQALPQFHVLDEKQKETAITAAYLHDVLEDTTIAREDLERYGFTPETIDTIEALTFLPEISTRDQYYERIREAGVVAVAVKLADIGHNTLRPRRNKLKGSPSNPVSEKKNNDYARLGRKYAKAYKALGQEVPSHLQDFV